jgi:hypothetical protein
MKFFFYGYVLLSSVLMCFASNDICVDSVTSKAFEEIKLNKNYGNKIVSGLVASQLLFAVL